ncbi:hypothetical protein C2845_PM09G22020 [Panicum miliaceum]|uniref:F-box domain-containing protein n=1 Tax=Panicum miliaceum TaxID=4540 RepID=A0A3L6S075_PANMI|nr:hypothetical protein C2845_PM09G22020 [Panicum miliaceum]
MKRRGAPARAHQPGGGGVVPNLNLQPPEDEVPALPPAAAADRISSLPQKARLRILSFLPFKAALALGMVSRRWFALVNTPQRSLDPVIGIHIHSAPGRCGCALGIHMHSDNIVPSLTDELDRRGRGPGPGRRLLRFILEVEDARMRPDDSAFLLDYAADCDVEDVLLVDARPGPPALSYNFERTSRRLVRLTLHGVRVGGIRRGRSYGTLEVIRIESTNLDNLSLAWILLSCPRLRVLELRRCGGITRVDVTVATARLLSLTVARCPEVADISAVAALGLRSFRYSGDRPRSVALPRSCFGDLYIALRRVRLGTGPLYNWLDALPNLSNLTVLTICSNALRIVSFLSAMTDLQPKCANLSNLQNLRELQLLIYEIKTLNLSDIYIFLRNCRCPRLKKLFVELPTVRKDSFMDAVSELPEEPPIDGFRNLVMAKITNFMWQCNEIELEGQLPPEADTDCSPGDASRKGSVSLAWILLSCPRLRVLELRRCGGITRVDVTVATARLLSLTVARCPEVADISAVAALGLRSFRYSGDRPRSVALPRSCFGDLYIALRRVRLGTGPLYNWLDALPNLSNLTVLTICSNALRIVSFLSAMTDLQPKCANLSNLQNLRELQLLIYEIKTLNLSDIYIFLRNCRCPRLKKLFVELPTVRKDSFMDAVSELPEEPPIDGFRNLVMAKITNFMWQCNEIELEGQLPPEADTDCSPGDASRKGSVSLAWILLSCPRLRVLELRRCGGITRVDVTVATARLLSLTVARCPEVADISAVAALGLRSFRYSGDRPRSVALPRSCFGDLYIALRRVRLGTGPLYNWLDALPNLSNLTVLTICSNALRIVSFLSAMTDLQPKCANLSNLQNLRELQLLIYEIKTLNLSDIYIFLRNCRCPRLKKLFVELPTVRKDSFMDAVSELPEEPPIDGFRNLVMAKITNFMWQCNEIELVHFLFRKASFLQKLILIAPQGTHPERDQSVPAAY